MAVIYNTAVKTSRMTATRDYFANGTLEILDVDNVVLAIFGLSVSGGSVTSGVWTLAFDASTVVASATGIATKARIKNSGGDAHLTGLTVGTTSSYDINMSLVSFTSGLDVTLTSATIAHA
jgi:hypothetical protein